MVQFHIVWYYRLYKHKHILYPDPTAAASGGDEYVAADLLMAPIHWSISEIELQYMYIMI